MPLLPVRVHVPTELQTTPIDEALPHPIVLLHPRTLAESASAPLLDAVSQSRPRSYCTFRPFGTSRKYTSFAGPQLCSQIIAEAELLEGRPSKSALESGQACYASELVAQAVRIPTRIPTLRVAQSRSPSPERGLAALLYIVAGLDVLQVVLEKFLA